MGSCLHSKRSVALIFAVPMVRLMMQSGNNSEDIPGMPIAMALYAANVFQDVWPLVSPLIGALGTFMSGSATVSNMLFSLFQFTVKLVMPTLVKDFHVIVNVFVMSWRRKTCCHCFAYPR
jgi:L-lactate permease